MPRRPRKSDCCPRPSRRGLGALGEPAHVGRIYLGHESGGGTVPRAKLEAITKHVARISGGNATAYPAAGRWINNETGSLVEEVTSVIEVVVSDGESCPAFTARMRRTAASAARAAKQQAVLTVNACASGKIDAQIVDDRGKTSPLLRSRGRPK